MTLLFIFVLFLGLVTLITSLINIEKTQFKTKKSAIIFSTPVIVIGFIGLVLSTTGGSQADQDEVYKVDFELITENWEESDKHFGGYDLSLGDFNDEGLARIGDNSSILLLIDNEEQIDKYNVIVRNGEALDIEKMSVLLSILISSPQEDNPSFSLSDFEELKSWIENQSNRTIWGNDVRFDGELDDTFYMFVYFGEEE